MVARVWMGRAPQVGVVGWGAAPAPTRWAAPRGAALFVCCQLPITAAGAAGQEAQPRSASRPARYARLRQLQGHRSTPPAQRAGRRPGAAAGAALSPGCHLDALRPGCGTAGRPCGCSTRRAAGSVSRPSPPTSHDSYRNYAPRQEAPQPHCDARRSELPADTRFQPSRASG
jgi:hypothetical protein